MYTYYLYILYNELTIKTIIIKIKLNYLKYMQLLSVKKGKNNKIFKL